MFIHTNEMKHYNEKQLLIIENKKLKENDNLYKKQIIESIDK
jgi:hypothetical protein